MNKVTRFTVLKNSLLLTLLLVIAFPLRGEPAPSDSTTVAETGSRGFALAIGVNSVDPLHYGGWDGELSGCENDALLMEQIARDQGLQVTTLLTAQAVRRAVLDKLEELARELKSGDLLVVSYSGHGGHLPDGNDEEEDGLDETWSLYDGELLDDELHVAWSKFGEGVRILVFSDSCHSGTMLKMSRTDLTNVQPERKALLVSNWNKLRIPGNLDRDKILDLDVMKKATLNRPELRRKVNAMKKRSFQSKNVRIKKAPEENVGEEDEKDEVFVFKSMPPRAIVETYQENKAFYDEIGTSVPKESDVEVKASVLLISGCQDDQSSVDLGFNSLLTWKVGEVWDSGNYQGDLPGFHREVKSKVLEYLSTQSPNLSVLGRDTDSFAEQRPFSIGGASNQVVYEARLSVRDHQNSRGVQLREIEDILRQDRANFHNGAGDPDDGSDSIFSTIEKRSAIDEMRIEAVGRSLDALKEAIQNGSPLVKVGVSDSVLSVEIIEP